MIYLFFLHLYVFWFKIVLYIHTLLVHAKEEQLPLLFVLFRIFDILKLPPANQIQNLKGGSGILLDDIVAGAQAWGVLQLLLLWKSPSEVVACLGLTS